MNLLLSTKLFYFNPSISYFEIKKNETIFFCDSVQYSQRGMVLPGESYIYLEIFKILLAQKVDFIGSLTHFDKAAYIVTEKTLIKCIPAFATEKSNFDLIVAFAAANSRTLRHFEIDSIFTLRLYLSLQPLKMKHKPFFNGSMLLQG